MNRNGDARTETSAITPVLLACKTSRFYYKPGSSMPTLKDLLGIEEQAENVLCPSTRAALRVIFSYGMRASEYLGLTTSHIIAPDLVFVRGKKRSGSYSILLPGLSLQVERRTLNPPLRSLSGETYMRLYRACLFVNVGLRLPGSKHIARTHLARHKIADSVSHIASDCEISDILRHRSSASQLHYGAERRANNGYLNRRNSR